MFNKLNYATFLHMLNTQNVATDAMFTAQKVETVAMLLPLLLFCKLIYYSINQFTYKCLLIYLFPF